jgi:hypothetical protein
VAAGVTARHFADIREWTHEAPGTAMTEMAYGGENQEAALQWYSYGGNRLSKI